LWNSDLWRSNLWRANLSGADLRGADLRGADLGSVEFDKCIMNWRSHNLIAERLRQSEGHDKWLLEISSIKGALVGCWDDYLKILPDEFIAWAIPHVISWITPNDELLEELEDAILAFYEKQARNQEKTA